MLRSLSSGVSGLRNHQMRMDVIGNNVANVNTVAFKAGRVVFKEGFAQMVESASRPAGDLGGTNPVQVGLGSAIASIDTIFTQPGEQGPVYGGTLAPTLRLDIRDTNTYVVEQLGYGYVPATQQTRRQQVGR